ncbi:MAG TPA: hypothetical protein VMU69_12145 [Bradyrhizobium sp.]|nr:hypothetical protein [Bradyrhizobium sp.]
MQQELRQFDGDQDTVGYTFHFQITNQGGRRACSVKVQASNFQDATQFFRDNWPMIESMAREGLTKPERGVISLAVPQL